MKSVAFFLYSDVLLLDVAGPMEVFSIANRYLPQEKGYTTPTIAAGNGVVRASNGIVLHSALSLNACNDVFDLLLLPGGPGAYDSDLSDALPQLREACLRARRYGSVCTGAFILGAMGLLDQHRVTTHWNYTQRLAGTFPLAIVEPDEIYINDNGLLTSGGVTAGIDMALAVVAEDHGKEIAVEVAKVILVSMKRQGGQARFSPLLRTLAHDDSPIGKVHKYILDNLHEDLCIDRLASMVAMSTRNFTRVFMRDLQMTPKEFVLKARVDRARHLLETSNLPIKTIAYNSGLGSERNMRFLFTEKLGVSPSEYRNQFA